MYDPRPEVAMIAGGTVTIYVSDLERAVRFDTELAHFGDPDGNPLHLCELGA